MGRYFFHIDGRRPHRDELGEELADDAAAWQTAIQLTREIETDFHPGHAWRLEVHDGSEPIYVVEIITHRRQKEAGGSASDAVT